jgi:hypothetical protein
MYPPRHAMEGLHTVLHGRRAVAARQVMASHGMARPCPPWSRSQGRGGAAPRTPRQARAGPAGRTARDRALSRARGASGPEEEEEEAPRGESPAALTAGSGALDSKSCLACETSLVLLVKQALSCL